MVPHAAEVPQSAASRVPVVVGEQRGRLRGALAVVVLGSVLLAGCSDSGEESPAADGTTSTAPADGPPAGAGPPEEFCRQAEEFSRTLGTVDASRIESFDVISTEVTRLSLVAPPDLAADLAVMSEYWTRLAAVDTQDAGEVGSLVQRDPEAEAAGQRVVAYLVDECGIEPVG